MATHHLKLPDVTLYRAGDVVASIVLATKLNGHGVALGCDADDTTAHRCHNIALDGVVSELRIP